MSIPRIQLIAWVTLFLVVGSSCAQNAQAEQPVANAGKTFRPIGDIIWLATLESGLSEEAPTAQSHPNTLRVPDSKIRYDIENLMRHPLMMGSQVEVLVRGQHVILRGKVLDGTQADAAETNARLVRGVASLKNQLRW